jgi:hypothetical protein
MPDEVDLADSKMTAHGFQIINIVVDASGELGGITDMIRLPAITKIVNDQRTILA